MSMMQLSGNLKMLDWNRTKEKASKMTIAQLEYAIKDCADCVYQGVDEGYYLDEQSIYYIELQKRK